MLDRDHEREREDEIFDSFPSLREADEWILAYIRTHPPDRYVEHGFPPFALLVSMCRSSVGVVQVSCVQMLTNTNTQLLPISSLIRGMDAQYLAIWCCCLMTHQRRGEWQKMRAAFVGEGLWERLVLLLDAL